MSSDSQVANRYARALLALAQEKKQAAVVREELQWVKQSLGAGQGRAMLLNPQLPASQKAAVVREVLQTKVSPLVMNLVLLIVAKRRAYLVAEIAAAYEREWLSAQKLQQVKIISAIPLAPEQLDHVRTRLQDVFRREVELLPQVDIRVKAGARIELGDRVLDATLTGRLGRLRRVLTREN